MGMSYMFRLLLSHHQALKIQIRVTMFICCTVDPTSWIIVDQRISIGYLSVWYSGLCGLLLF